MSNEPIFSMLTGKGPCAYGGVVLDGSTVNGVVMNGTNCQAGLIGPYCRGGVVIQNGVGWCCFGPCINNGDCLNNNPCNEGTCCTSNYCSYCASIYAPQNNPNFTSGGLTNDATNCPPGTAAEGPYSCEGTFGEDTECWTCIKYTGPFYDVTAQDLYPGGPLYLERCPVETDYILPAPFDVARCSPDNRCCDLNTEDCVANLGCVPNS